MRWTRCALRAGALLIGVTVSCGGLPLADTSHDVQLRNATETIVLLYEDNTDPPSPPVRLEPGATRHNVWLWPVRPTDSLRRTVVALSLERSLLYCQEFTYQELERLQWRVEITRGAVSCQPR